MVANRRTVGVAILVASLTFPGMSKDAKTQTFSWPDDVARIPKTVKRLKGGATLTSAEIKAHNSAYHGLKLVWITLPASARFQVILSGRNGHLPEVYELAAKKTYATALSSGGYAQDVNNGSCSSKGLIRAPGKEISKKVRWDFGGMFLWSSSQGFDIWPVAKYNSTSSTADWVLQSEPILVANGVVDKIPPTDDKADRVALAIDQQHRPVIIGVFGNGLNALSLYDFARLLESLGAIGGPRLDRALNMDGGPLAHIYVPELSLHFGNLTDGCVSNLVAFTSDVQH
jgi:hypothetical protein